MAFGKRRFTQLVYRGERTHSADKVHSWYEARFVPLDLGGADECLTEEALIRAIDDNGRRVPFPLPDLEEKLALKALQAQAKGKTFSRAAVESVAARGMQRVIVDVLDLDERTKVERFRKILAKRQLATVGTTLADHADTSIAAVHDLLDASRDALTVFDRYLPRPKL